MVMRNGKTMFRTSTESKAIQSSSNQKQNQFNSTTKTQQKKNSLIPFIHFDSFHIKTASIQLWTKILTFWFQLTFVNWVVQAILWNYISRFVWQLFFIFDFFFLFISEWGFPTTTETIMSRNKVVQRLKITNESDFVLNGCDSASWSSRHDYNNKNKNKCLHLYGEWENRKKPSTYDHYSNYCIKRI